MNTRLVKKILLHSLIVFFSILILAQSTWAGKWADTPSDLNLVIQRVYVDLDNSLIFVTGENFGNGASPDVTLGGINLKVDSYTQHDIIAKFPVGIPDGDYKLVVYTGPAVKQYDAYIVTIGAVGPQGPPGSAGTTEWKIVDNDGVADWGTSRIEGTANCDIVNGYTVTGGGFEASTSVTIIVSKPLKDANGNGIGWYVSGRIIGELPTLKIHAVCAKVQ